MKIDLKTLIVLVAIVLVAAVGSAYVTSWMFSGGASSPPAAAPAIDRAKASEWDNDLVWDVGVVTVNLLSNAPISNYVKTGMSFVVNEKKTVDIMEKRRIQILDKVITVWRTTTAEELRSAEGLDRVKQRFISEVNQLIAGESGRVEGVYFSELVVQ